jgi:hypothetical protein
MQAIQNTIELPYLFFKCLKGLRTFIVPARAALKLPFLLQISIYVRYQNYLTPLCSRQKHYIR